jgi:hypothetical protein
LLPCFDGKKEKLKLLTIAYFIYRYIKSNKRTDGGTIIKKPQYIIDVPAPEKISETQFNVGTDKFPLRKGSKGSNVKLLQQALTKLSTDSIFGNLTEAALVSQTGKNSVGSLNEIKAIAKKNGLGFVMTSDGIGKFVREAEVSIIQNNPDFRPDIFK